MVILGNIELQDVYSVKRVDRLENGEKIYIGPFLYQMRRDVPNHCYMGSVDDANDAIFRYLGIQNKMEWCKEQGVTPVGAGVFPYFTDEGIVKIVNILIREFTKFKRLGKKPHYNGWNGTIV